MNEILWTRLFAPYREDKAISAKIVGVEIDEHLVVQFIKLLFVRDFRFEKEW